MAESRSIWSVRSTSGRHVSRDLRKNGKVSHLDLTDGLRTGDSPEYPMGHGGRMANALVFLLWARRKEQGLVDGGG